MEDKALEEVLAEEIVLGNKIADVIASSVIKSKPPVSYEKRLRKMSNQELRRESTRLQKLGKHPRPVEQTGRGMNYGAATHTDLHTQATGIVLDAVLDAFEKGRSRFPGDKKR